jgi:hypothetical protein
MDHQPDAGSHPLTSRPAKIEEENEA